MSMINNNNLINEGSDLMLDAATATPPVFVSGLTLFGVQLHDWVYLATLLYTFIAIVTIIRKNWITNNTAKNISNKDDNDKES